MKISIGGRLLLALLLSFVVVASISVELVRWKLLNNFSDYPAAVESERLDGLVASLSAQYLQHGGWSFLPADPMMRTIWLREAFVEAQGEQQRKTGEKLWSPTLGYRIGLLDKDRHYLAGAIANRFIVVFASIDRINTPLLVNGKTVGYLVRAKPQNPDDGLAVAFLIDQQKNILAIAAFSVLLSALVAALLAATFRKPIRRLVAGARLLEHGQFGARLNIRRSDELGELAETFDHLAARLEEMERSRRQWGADTSHELRTPLSVLRGQLEALQDGIRTATPDNIAVLLRQVLSLTKLVDELHELARSDIGQLRYVKSPVDVWQLVQDELEGFSEKIRMAGLDLVIGTAPVRSMVNCDVDRIRQVLGNLLENCVRHTARGGCIEINAVIVNDELRVLIDDSEPGVPESSLGRLGERFFRAEASRNRKSGGSGLGLALSRQIVEAHEGRLEFGLSPLGGLRAGLALKLED